MKCGEEKPRCSNCERLDEECDYKIRLSWGGRPLKKKQLDNNNGQDPSGDDQSQFIPGAGQFSINPHFPAPQTFVTASTSNGAQRKPPVPRVGNGKKTNMSNFQTVFAVGETSVLPPPPPPAAPPQPPAVKPANGVAQVDPRLSISIPASQAQHGRSQSVSQAPVTQRPSAPTRHNSTSYGWGQHGLPPHSAASNGSFDDSNGRNDHGYSPYTPTTGTYSPQTASPTSHHYNPHSPQGHMGSSSPDSPYAVLTSSPEQHTKNFHHPPPIVTSPPMPKKVRTTTSPTQPPPNSPFIFGRHNTGYGGTSMPGHTSSIAETLDYMSTPTTSAPLSSIADLHHAMGHSTVTGVDMGSHTIMRRVSVENLLSAPLPTSYSNGYDRYPSDMDGFKTEDIPSTQPDSLQYNVGQETDDEDEVEEIIRDDLQLDGSGFGSALQVNGFNGAYRMNSYLDFAIPGRLDPLPQLLRGNKKNRMYFHHYLNHTARLLVPHDCSENPFKSILPQSV